MIDFIYFCLVGNNKMSIPITFLIHKGGQMGLGIAGFEYDISDRACISKRIKIKTKPTFAELVHKIFVKLGLGVDERVCRVVYKCPINNQGSLFWTGMNINDDDDIDQIYENLDRYPGYTLVELIIETEKITIGWYEVAPDVSGEMINEVDITEQPNVNYNDNVSFDGQNVRDNKLPFKQNLYFMNEYSVCLTGSNLI